MVARTNSKNSARGILPSSGETSSKGVHHLKSVGGSKPKKAPSSTKNSKSSNPRPVDLDGSSRPHFSEYPKIDQAIANMRASLGRFTRANDRRMILRTLKDVKYLKAMPIEPRPAPIVDLEELELEVAKENMILNGQAFHRKTKFGRTSTDFLHVLHELCYQLCENASSGSSTVMVLSGNASTGNASSMASSVGGGMPMSPDTLYYDLLCRLARTITSADCFGKLNDVLGSGDLILMNASAERKPKSKKNPNGTQHDSANNNTPPIELNIFEEGGNIHAHIVTTLGYGLYRKLDVNTGRPWIKMQAELNERMNFSTGSQVRHVTIHWPDMYV